MTHQMAEPSREGDLSSFNARLLMLLATGAGLSVANSYYNQPMLGTLAAEFSSNAAAISVVPVATLVGNTIGVVFIAPLGDRLERRKLILLTTIALALALASAAFAWGLVPLVVSSFFIGLFATVAQQIVPLSVHIAPAEKKGQTLGFVTGGILLGILLSRAVSGTVTEWWDWRAMFLIASAMMLMMAILFAFRLPTVRPTTDVSYPKLLHSLWTLFREHRTLRLAVIVQSLIFGAFLSFWSNLALLFATNSYGLGPSAVGIMAVIGAAGVLAAPAAGRFADRRGPHAVITIGAALVLAAFAIFAAIPGSLVALAIGVLVMDVAVQSSQVANQARVFALDPSARSRLNTVFMAIMLLGGAIGAGLGGLAFSKFGWIGTCAVGAAAASLAMLVSLIPTDQPPTARE